MLSFPGKSQTPQTPVLKDSTNKPPAIPDSLVFLTYKELQESLSAFNTFLSKNMTYDQYTVSKVDLLLSTYWKWLKEQPVKNTFVKPKK